jgi:hypothetical protein
MMILDCFVDAAPRNDGNIGRAPVPQWASPKSRRP